MALTSLNGQM